MLRIIDSKSLVCVCYRQAYRQKAEALNSMLAKELLLLAVHIDRENIKRNNTCFLNAFAKVMDTYSSVFTYFIRSKESQYDCLVGLKVILYNDLTVYVLPILCICS